MNTEQKQAPDLRNFALEPSSEEEISAKLLAKYEALKRDRVQERFYFITAIILLLDVLLLKQCEWYLCFFILAVECAVILSLAEKWAVPGICAWTQKGLDLAHKRYDAAIARFSKK